MLLFKPRHRPLILDGTKTQTRRKWEKCRVRVGSIHQARTTLFGEPFARLKILKVRQPEPVSAISDSDARAEGYPDAAAFLDVWRWEFGCEDDRVWVVEFEVVGEWKP